MNVTLWGTRGSLATPGPDTTRYGGNTACVQVDAEDGTVLVLDAGTGIRRLGVRLGGSVRRVDVLLTHLHMDHIQGLGFFAPLYNPNMEVNIWGQASTTLSLRQRLGRYLSPPLFPVRLRDLDCALHLHEVPCGDFAIGPFRIACQHVCHPGPTVGYRISAAGATLTYLPDHEPALGAWDVPREAEWTSGHALAAGADLLIHDAQYTDAQYRQCTGWGHSSLRQAFQFAALARIRRLVPFHHDPSHDDDTLDRLFAAAVAELRPAFAVAPGQE
ncbi:MAG: MBL fold metallo-hydrolase, partial [Pseudomonadota bacterium]|nr:MBL fold metallo-hydrolase [Pseudomonadota bacterium]